MKVQSSKIEAQILEAKIGIDQLEEALDLMDAPHEFNYLVDEPWRWRLPAPERDFVEFLRAELAYAVDETLTGVIADLARTESANQHANSKVTEVFRRASANIEWAAIEERKKRTAAREVAIALKRQRLKLQAPLVSLRPGGPPVPANATSLGQLRMLTGNADAMESLISVLDRLRDYWTVVSSNDAANLQDRLYLDNLARTRKLPSPAVLSQLLTDLKAAGIHALAEQTKDTSKAPFTSPTISFVLPSLSVRTAFPLANDQRFSEIRQPYLRPEESNPWAAPYYELTHRALTEVFSDETAAHNASLDLPHQYAAMASALNGELGRALDEFEMLLDAYRGGDISVPFPVRVSGLLRGEHAWVNSGEPVATVHPTHIARMNVGSARGLRHGTVALANVSCDKTALAEGDVLFGWRPGGAESVDRLRAAAAALTKLHRELLASAEWVATVEVESSDKIVSLSLPEHSWYFDGTALSSDERAALRLAGVPEKSGRFYALSQSPLRHGVKCSVSLFQR